MKAQNQEHSGRTQERTTAVGVFEDRMHADRAVAELREDGFRDDQIGLAMRHDLGEFEADVKFHEWGSEVGAGAATGALAGLGLGALAGLGVLAGMIPVIGPAIAGGTLGVILSNAAAGAGIAGLVGALIGVGIPEEEAGYYQDEFAAGKVVVTVQAADRVREAEEILSRNYAYNIHSERKVDGGTAATLEVPVERKEIDVEREPARNSGAGAEFREGQ